MKRSAPGFTLLEILIAVLILSVVVTTIYASFNGTLRVVKNSNDGGGIYAMARTAMDLMTRDLEAMAPYDRKMAFLARRSDCGEKESMDITFRSSAHLSFDENNATGGIADIQYYLKEGENEGEGYTLMRDDVPVMMGSDRIAAKAGFAVCKGVQSVIYRFYDASGKEYEKWDSGTGADGQQGKAPAFVAVTLNIINPEAKDKPYSFSTKIYIPLSQGVSS